MSKHVTYSIVAACILLTDIHTDFKMKQKYKRWAPFRVYGALPSTYDQRTSAIVVVTKEVEFGLLRVYFFLTQFQNHLKICLKIDRDS